MRSLRVSILILIIVGAVPSTGASNDLDGIRMELSTEETQYVVGEPIKFRVRITNTANRQLNIVPPDELIQSGEFISYEIRYRDGSFVPIKLQNIFINRAIYQGWTGTSLPTGESVEVILYPPPKYFGAPGRWEARVVYEIHEVYGSLWRPDGGALRSNIVTLDIRAATKQEKDILDVYWQGYRKSGYEEYDIMVKVDESQLRSAIDEYGSQPLAKYLVFLYARYFVGVSHKHPERAKEAIKILSDLRKEKPCFRFEETNYLLGWAYYIAGDAITAEQVFHSAVKERPELYDLWWFVFRWMWFKTDSYRGSDDILRVDSRAERILMLSKQQPN